MFRVKAGASQRRVPICISSSLYVTALLKLLIRPSGLPDHNWWLLIESLSHGTMASFAHLTFPGEEMQAGIELRSEVGWVNYGPRVTTCTQRQSKDR
jgi:hypothetical protein